MSSRTWIPAGWLAVAALLAATHAAAQTPDANGFLRVSNQQDYERAQRHYQDEQRYNRLRYQHQQEQRIQDERVRQEHLYEQRQFDERLRRGN